MVSEKKLYLQTSSFGESLFGNETKKWAGCSVKISFCNNLDKLTIFVQLFLKLFKGLGDKIRYNSSPNIQRLIDWENITWRDYPCTYFLFQIYTFDLR